MVYSAVRAHIFNCLHKNVSQLKILHVTLTGYIKRVALCPQALNTSMVVRNMSRFNNVPYLLPQDMKVIA